jgi:hypothetical protein
MPRWPSPGDEEIAAVTEVLRSGRINYWTGTQGRTLETEYAASLDRAHGIAVANGTVALELALRAFGVGPGDEVIVPARTFIATASSAVAVGATPVIADIDPLNGNMTAETVRAVLTNRTRAIIPVHFGGWPVEMPAIVELASQHDLVVIEDCAQAHGATLAGRPVGGLGSHAATFSFCQDKIVPVGDAGLLVLDDDHAFERAWAYKDHGKSLAKVNDPEFMGAEEPFKWLHDSFGTNWRLDEMSAAVARVGLRKLPQWHAARRRNALRLAQGLADLDVLTVPLPPNGSEHGFYRLYTYVHPKALRDGWDRDRIIRAITAEGTPCQYGGCAEIYRERAFAGAGLRPPNRLPSASRAHETSIAFFVHPTLSENDIADTIAAARSVIESAAR